MTVSIVADSAASLPARLTSAHGIRVVPMQLVIDGVSHDDGTIGLEEVIARVDGFSSSGPSPGRFVEAIEAASGPDGVVVCTVARTMSSTFDSAHLAASQIDGTAVEVVDTGTAAGGEGLVVLAAVAAAERGAPLADVVAAAQAASERVRLVATLDSLDHLAKSGRVPDAAAWAGRWLHVNPLFEFRHGEPKPLRPSHSRPAALDRILTRWRHSRLHGARLHVCALHALDPEPADRLLERVVAEAGDACATAFVAPFSAVMVAHTGPRLVGLAWWWEPEG